MAKTLICSECKATLRPWERMVSWENTWLCPDCFKSYISDLTLDELAELVGSEVETVENIIGG